MATLTQAIDEMKAGFFGNDKELAQEFQDFVRANGVNLIYVIEYSRGEVGFDFMGEPTEFSDIFHDNAEYWMNFTSPEEYEDGYIFGEEIAFVYVDSLN